MNKSGVMESQELRVTEEQNSKSALAKETLVLKLFAEFYGIEKIPRHSELTKNCEIVDNNDTSLNTFKMSSILNVFKTKGKFDQFRGYKEIPGTINSKQFLYIPGYNQRNRIVFEILMAEANYRAKKAKKKAYIHVVSDGRIKALLGFFLNFHNLRLVLAWVFGEFTKIRLNYSPVNS